MHRDQDVRRPPRPAGEDTCVPGEAAASAERAPHEKYRGGQTGESQTRPIERGSIPASIAGSEAKEDTFAAPKSNGNSSLFNGSTTRRCRFAGCGASWPVLSCADLMRTTCLRCTATIARMRGGLVAGEGGVT